MDAIWFFSDDGLIPKLLEESVLDRAAAQNVEVRSTPLKTDFSSCFGKSDKNQRTLNKVGVCLPIGP
ncbi:MAG TPA: hypothetical protein DCE71_02295 [Parachlamydiales bacterium]|nr:hypothetical protein [Parachlamydiales bacterium]